MVFEYHFSHTFFFWICLILQLNHGIKLYPPGVPQVAPTSTKEPVLAEHYDEVVFTDPNETFYRQLMQTSLAPKIQSGEANVQKSFGVYSDADDFHKLVEAQNFLSKELQTVKERMRIAPEELQQVEDGLREVQEAKKASSSSRTSGKTKGSSAAGHAAKKAKISHWFSVIACRYLYDMRFQLLVLANKDRI